MIFERKCWLDPLFQGKFWYFLSQIFGHFESSWNQLNFWDNEKLLSWVFSWESAKPIRTIQYLLIITEFLIHDKSGLLKSLYLTFGTFLNLIMKWSVKPTGTVDFMGHGRQSCLIQGMIRRKSNSLDEQLSSVSRNLPWGEIFFLWDAMTCIMLQI